MKWFKHQANARNDEKVSQLEDKAGLEGYGFYFKMLEIVAEVMDQTDRHDVSYSLTRWGRQTNITSKKWLFLSQCCADVGLMIVQRDSDNITVKIPKLLKHRDNHTKNLQATSKQEVDIDIDIEVDKDKEKQTTPPADKSASKVDLPAPDFIDGSLWADFIEVRKGLKAKNTVPAMKALITQLTKLKDQGHDPSEVVRASIRSSWKDLYPLKTNSAGFNSRDAGRQVAAKSIFKPENTAHLMGNAFNERGIIDVKSITV